MREKCPNTEFPLVLIFLYLDQKKLRIWTKLAGDTKIVFEGSSALTIFPSEINLKYSFEHLSKSKQSCILNEVPR